MDLDLSHTENTINNNSFSNELKLSKIYFSVDRFEGEFAICENTKTGEFVNIKKSLLPENVKEGSIIKYENNSYVLDNEATNKKQANIKKMVDNLFNN